MWTNIYTDRGKVYKVNVSNAEKNMFITQYECALNELDIELIHAYSPQAKGRVERSFKTDQDRLVKELKLAEIETLRQANDFLDNTYTSRHNKKFANIPTRPDDLHRSINDFDLENIFTIRTKRKVTNNWTILYHKQLLQLDNSSPAIVKPKDIVTVHERMNETLFITIRNQQINFTTIDKNAPRMDNIKKTFTFYKPAKNHPWRNSTISQQSEHF